ncbi:hypothetical protein [Thermogemmatispora sp.]|uniref:hypothetical protein n=1 Tax=Thermogemmatispora sp. TaxID=1968838 RepID=UPI001D8A3CB0|nr:hypothetical protein [Thermogemmatispora sp.]MBX5450740.1 hypothetical protein [Thermogemmatispora sp.]
MVIYGFDWRRYRDQVMPAFARWLMANEAAAVEALYTATRLAHEEAFLPAAMQAARTWPRALAFVVALPRGPHSLYEYRLLCSAEEFTALSDRYLYRYVPHLHRPSEALATVWGAIVEHYCLSGELLAKTTTDREAEPAPRRSGVALISQAAEESADSPYQLSETYFELAGAGSGLSPDQSLPAGLSLGQHPNLLRLRGWLATISPAALALFEYLACGRRALPFEDSLTTPGQMDLLSRTSCHYIGYLTPAEVRRLADCLRAVAAPDPEAAARDYECFRQGLASSAQERRLIDEVLPTHGMSLLTAVRLAAEQNLGLICRQG